MKTIKVILFMTLTILMVSCTERRPTVLVIKEVEIVNKNLYRYVIKSVTPGGTTWDSFSYFTYDFIGMPGDTVKIAK